MKIDELERQANRLAESLARANRADRLQVQPQVRRIVDLLTARGEPVPSKLRRINQTLENDAYEDLFDNMPV